MNLFHSSGLEGGGIPESPRLPQREIPEAPAADLQLSFHRPFDPAVGQWLSEEPAAFAARDQNLRPYAGSAKEG